jgi:hypothetical protein
MSKLLDPELPQLKLFRVEWTLIETEIENGVPEQITYGGVEYEWSPTQQIIIDHYQAEGGYTTISVVEAHQYEIDAYKAGWEEGHDVGVITERLKTFTPEELTNE